MLLRTMMELSNIYPFIISTVVLSLAPGPDNIFVLMQSLQKGFGQAFKVILGLCSGLALHTMAGALGLTVIVKNSLFLYKAIIYSGAGYLIYLAYLSWKSRNDSLNLEDSEDDKRNLYLRGVIMNITNPKIAIFFLAYFPQFINEKKDVTTQFITLGLIFALVCLVVFGAVAIIAGKLRVFLTKNNSFNKYSNLLAMVVYTVLAVKIVFF